MVEDVEVDVLVAGGGVGGLMAAYRAQEAGARVLLLGGSGGASNRISSMNTALGYAPQDTPAGVFDDIVRAGGAVNNLELVAALAARIGPETTHLAEIGVPFLRDGDRLARRQATGSTWTRAVYSAGMIGVDISRQLVAEIERGTRPAAMHVKGGLLLRLFTNDGQVSGALAYSSRDRTWLNITAPAVVLATGGAGQLFATTTNPRGSRGIGYAAALEAGAALSDMEFISFEPFVTSAPEHAKGHDLPTTVLREGVRLRNGMGEEFLDTESAPTKDIICRAMVREVLEGRGTPSGSIYFDVRGMKPGAVERYMQIEQAFRALGDSPPADGRLEVMPAQHFLMGGVSIDRHGGSTLPGLFGVGEVAAGAHGGHRLAAGGGLEVVAGGAISGESAAEYSLTHRGRPSLPSSAPEPELLGHDLDAGAETGMATIRAALSDGCGILRNATDLTASVEAISGVLDQANDTNDTFLRRSALIALSIADSALARAESRGDHFRIDHDQRNDVDYLGNFVIGLDADGRLSRRFDRVGSLCPA